MTKCKNPENQTLVDRLIYLRDHKISDKKLFDELDIEFSSITEKVDSISVMTEKYFQNTRISAEHLGGLIKFKDMLPKQKAEIIFTKPLDILCKILGSPPAEPVVMYPVKVEDFVNGFYENKGRNIDCINLDKYSKLYFYTGFDGEDVDENIECVLGRLIIKDISFKYTEKNENDFLLPHYKVVYALGKEVLHAYVEFYGAPLWGSASIIRFDKTINGFVLAHNEDLWVR